MLFIPLTPVYLIVSSVLVAAMALLVIVDIILGLNQRHSDNINHVLYCMSSDKLLFIPFFWGAVVGHLFFGSSEPLFNLSMLQATIALGIITILLLIAGFVFSDRLKFKRRNLFMLVLGIAFGHFVWTMSYTEPCIIEEIQSNIILLDQNEIANVRP